jgi:hypothetical protein
VASVMIEIGSRPGEVDTIEVIEDLDVLSESNRCSCSAGDDQPY